MTRREPPPEALDNRWSRRVKAELAREMAGLAQPGVQGEQGEHVRSDVTTVGDLDDVQARLNEVRPTLLERIDYLARIAWFRIPERVRVRLSRREARWVARRDRVSAARR